MRSARPNSHAHIELIEREQMRVVTNTASLVGMVKTGPCAIIAAEGADFLEGQVDRVDEAYTQHQLRHLQLTHYRVNELGDIQTEPPVHGGLTDFGADVVHRCNASRNRRGCRAWHLRPGQARGRHDDQTAHPLAYRIGHASIGAKPPDHAGPCAGDRRHGRRDRRVAEFRDVSRFAGDGARLKRMADVVGVEHVGLGTDMLGFIYPPVFRSYEQLPRLARCAVDWPGSRKREVGMILGRQLPASVRGSVG